MDANWIKKIKDWLPVLGIVAGFIVAWVTLTNNTSLNSNSIEVLQNDNKIREERDAQFREETKVTLATIIANQKNSDQDIQEIKNLVKSVSAQSKTQTNPTQ